MSWQLMKRLVAAALALFLWVSLGLQLYLTLRQSFANGMHLAQAIITYLSYLTNLSNMLATAIFTSLSIFPLWAIRKLPSGLSAGVTLYVAMVGLLFVLFLRDDWHPRGLALIASVNLHYLSPIVCAVYWLIFAGKGHLKWKHACLWPLFPALYACFILARGALIGVYPYTLIDPQALGYSWVLANITMVLAGYLALGLCMVGVDRHLAIAYGERCQPVGELSSR